ncbi:hypothetical protein P885DRAFT_66635 [Corynascus similis CBS 632.67]
MDRYTTSWIRETESGYCWYQCTLDKPLLKIHRCPAQAGGQPASLDVAVVFTVYPERNYCDYFNITLIAPSFTIFAALVACMWWGRRRREKKEERVHTERLDSSRGLGEEQVPRGLESVFNPMTQSGRGSVFDRSEGRMAKADSLVGFSPLSYDLRQSVVGGDSQSGIVDPPNPNNAREFRTPSSISELGSNPIHGGPIGPTGRIEKAESRSQTARRSKAEAIPRAILDTTEQETSNYK